MNIEAQPVAASVRAIGRRLSGPVDLLALYARLSDAGTRADTAFIETTAGKSIIVDRAAIRIECRGERVVLDALSSTGEPVLDVIERNLHSPDASRSARQLTVRYDRSREVDADRRLFDASPFDVLRTVLASFTNRTPEEPMALCLVGVIAFDHVDLFEELPPNREDPTGFPDFVFWLAESAVIAEPGLAPRLICSSFGSGDEDQQQRSANSAIERLRDLAFRASDIRPLTVVPGARAEISVDLTDEEFAGAVTKLKDHIRAGDVYQIVASRTFRAPCADPLSAFARVRAIDRSPYMFFVSMADCALFGASPETSVRVFKNAQDKIVEVKPIAGTRPRGKDEDEDNRMEADLRLDEKEAAEPETA